MIRIALQRQNRPMADIFQHIDVSQTAVAQSAAQCMPAGDAAGTAKKGGSFLAVRRAFSSFTGGSRKVLFSGQFAMGTKAFCKFSGIS